jgi:adenylate kinase
MSTQLQQQEFRVVYSFFGPPGSGKGTLAEQLKNELAFEVLSTGNLCRFHIAQKTPMGKQIQELVDNGHLIPDSLMAAMVLEWLEERVRLKKSVILDGFPRTAGQAVALMEFLKKCDGYHFRVAFIELAAEEILKRLLGRKVCSNQACQAVYDKTYVDDNCQQCGSVLVRRVDDKEEVIRERLRLYPAHRDELLEMYRNLNIHIEDFNVMGMSKAEVFSTFKATL